MSDPVKHLHRGISCRRCLFTGRLRGTCICLPEAARNYNNTDDNLLTSSLSRTPLAQAHVEDSILEDADNQNDEYGEPTSSVSSLETAESGNHQQKTPCDNRNSLPTPPKKLIHIFDLPPELFLMIFNFAIESRRVNLRFGRTNNRSLVSDCPVPKILHISKIFRTLALDTYKLSFGQPRLGQEARVYFNPRLDTIYFDALGHTSTIQDNERMQLVNLPSHRLIGAENPELRFFTTRILPNLDFTITALALSLQTVTLDRRIFRDCITRFTSLKELFIVWSTSDLRSRRLLTAEILGPVTSRLWRRVPTSSPGDARSIARNVRLHMPGVIMIQKFEHRGLLQRMSPMGPQRRRRRSWSTF